MQHPHGHPTGRMLVGIGAEVWWVLVEPVVAMGLMPGSQQRGAVYPLLGSPLKTSWGFARSHEDIGTRRSIH